MQVRIPFYSKKFIHTKIENASFQSSLSPNTYAYSPITSVQFQISLYFKNLISDLDTFRRHSTIPNLYWWTSSVKKIHPKTIYRNYHRPHQTTIWAYPTTTVYIWAITTSRHFQRWRSSLLQLWFEQCFIFLSFQSDFLRIQIPKNRRFRTTTTTPSSLEKPINNPKYGADFPPPIIIVTCLVQKPTNLYVNTMIQHMTFGGSPCPPLWGYTSDTITDVPNQIIQNPW